MPSQHAILAQITENAGSVFAFVVSAALAVIAAHYARKSYRQDKALAARQPKLEIHCYGAQRPAKTLFVLPFAQSDLFIVPLVFDVTNSGQLAATNVELYLEVPDAIYGRDIPRELSRIAEARGQIHAAQEGRNEHLTTVLMSLKNLAPGESCRVVPQIMFTKTTQLPWTVNSTTRDDKNVTIKGLVQYAWTGQARITCTEIAPFAVPLSIEVIKGKVDDAAAVLQAETNDALRKWGERGSPPPPQFTAVSFSTFKDTEATAKDQEKFRLRVAETESAVILSSRLV
jgi:hypothetical protein